MFVCNDCSGVFQEPAQRTETAWVWGRPEECVWSVCPECGSDDFSEGVECGICGGLVSYLAAERADSGYVCAVCIGLTGRRAVKALSQLFTPKELDALRIYIESIYSQGGHLV